MAQKVRVARLDASHQQPQAADGAGLWDSYSAINGFIRRYLPAASAQILAEPVRGAAAIDWCTDMAGQPQPLTALAPADRAKVERVLADRLQALRDLAARNGGDPTAALLAAAVAPPSEEAVYAVNGQPVIVGWGRQGGRVVTAPSRPVVAAAAAIPAAAAAVSAAPAAAETLSSQPPASPQQSPEEPPRRRGGWWWWLAGLAALVLLGLLLWWVWGHFGGAALGGRPDTTAAEEAALKAEIAAAEDELRRRLQACPVPKAEPPAKTTDVIPDPVPAPQLAEDQPPPPEPEVHDTPAPQTHPAPPPAAKPKAVKPAPPAKTEQKVSCPAPRKKWEAPELVVLLDASGSMHEPADAGRDRLGVAKDAVRGMVNGLPADVDVGLVVFGQCAGADNHQFFSAGERGRLNALLSQISPMRGTPLARGVERAGNIVDGRSVPATLVVVTDGADSCRGDPCAVARALKAAKPKLTINVVDVGGEGLGRCMADITGGKVYPMTAPSQLPDLMRRASGEQPVPPGCPQ